MKGFSTNPENTFADLVGSALGVASRSSAFAALLLGEFRLCDFEGVDALIWDTEVDGTSLESLGLETIVILGAAFLAVRGVLPPLVRGVLLGVGPGDSGCNIKSISST
jgi:hypothetical protein